MSTAVPLSPVDASARAARAPRVDGERLLRVLHELARFGGEPDGGVSRIGYGLADDQARRYLARLCREAGLVATVDQAANLIVRRPCPTPGAPALLMGSHLDGVRRGGWLDGVYGVVAAIEVVRVLAEHPLDGPARPARPAPYEPVAVAFANQEGARFPYRFFGSLALVGQLQLPEQTVDRSGRSLRDPLRAAGGDLDRIHLAAWPPESIAAYLELHVEQGPVLDHAGAPIGVVSAIAGRTIYDLRVTGERAHAGTTPMERRRDALTAVARLVLAVESVARDRQLCHVATVGVVEPEPNLDDVIAGEVGMTAEIRDVDPARIAAGEQALEAEVAAVAEATGATIEMAVRTRTAPVATDPGLRHAIATAAGEQGHPCLELPSGRAHDAQIVSRAAPIGMIFVPSRDGISQSPAEDTDPADLIAGADTLLNTARCLQAQQMPLAATS